MKLKTFLFSTVMLSALFLSAFGLPRAPRNAAKLQETVIVPDVTDAPPTDTGVTTPGVIPVTGEDSPGSQWALILFGLLGLLGITFLVALFSRSTTQEPVDHAHPTTTMCNVGYAGRAFLDDVLSFAPCRKICLCL